MKLSKYIFAVLVLIIFVNASKIRREVVVTEKKADNELTDRIRMSFKGGNPKMLATCLNQEIELVIDSEKIDFQKISSQQAEQIFRLFFQHNPPLSFQYVYQGASNVDLRYSVANYRSRNKDFLVYILVKRDSNNKYVIDTIQFRES